MFLNKLWELMVGPKDDYAAQLRSVLILGLILAVAWLYNNTPHSTAFKSHIDLDEKKIEDIKKIQSDMDKEIDQIQVLLHEIHANQKVMMDILQGKYNAIQ